jgi:RNA 3'-terminal phosphate cyclase (ATP)
MAALTQQPAKVHEIRANSKFRGLDVEDLTLISALQQVVSAEMIGAEPASESLSFIPNSRPRGFKGTVSTQRNDLNRGANALVVISSLLPILARSGVYSSVLAEGETFGMHALSYDYFAEVALPALRKVGIYAFPELVRSGFGRESNGKVAVDVEPSSFTGLDWKDRGGLKRVSAVVSFCSLQSAVADRMASHLIRLGQSSGLSIEPQVREVDGSNRGAYVTVFAEYQRGFGGGTAMAVQGVRAEAVAQQAFDEMLDWMASSGTVDPYLADQLLIPLAFAEGSSSFSVSRLTKRFLTIVWVVKQFLPIHITVRGAENGPGIVTITRG